VSPARSLEPLSEVDVAVPPMCDGLPAVSEVKGFCCGRLFANDSQRAVAAFEGADPRKQRRSRCRPGFELARLTHHKRASSEDRHGPAGCSDAGTTRNPDATVAASVALGEAAIPQLVRLVPFDCRSVALSPSDCESGPDKGAAATHLDSRGDTDASFRCGSRLGRTA
jgi:hypothetical protein